MSENNPAAATIFTIHTLDRGTVEEREDILAIETHLSIVLDNEELVSLMCSPGKEEFLALGFLRGEGLITTMDDVETLEYDPAAGRISLSLAHGAGGSWKKHARRRTSSGAPAAVMTVPGGCREPQASVDPSVLIALMEIFSSNSPLFATTGCVHSAFDKVAGEALARALDCTGKILFTSGRISSEVVRKADLLGIAAIVSPSAPTSLAVEMACTRGIRLLGFTRGSRANLY